MGRLRTVTLLAVLLVACGGNGESVSTGANDGTAGPATSLAAEAGDSTTSTGATTTTAEPATTTSTAGVGLEDIPPECTELITEILHIYEPAVSGIDWANATIEDHLQVIMALGSASIDDAGACDIDLAVTDEEGTDLFLAIARQEAPGAVGYFEAQLAMTEALEGREATGDCRTDIATFESIVAGGVPLVDLPLPEQWLVLSLMSSIGYCSLQTQGELMFREEVQEFLAGSPLAGE